MTVALTISPFLNLGGSHDTIIFVFDDGIAFILCGALGTVKRKGMEKKLIIKMYELIKR